MKSPKFRTSLFRLHAFLGLHVCLVLGLIFLSGSILIFAEEIEASYTKVMRLSKPATSHSATFGQIYDNIKAFDSDLEPLDFERSSSLWMGDKTLVRTYDWRKAYVWSHPQTAEILGVTGTSSLHNIFNSLHVDLMTGNRIGTILNSTFSVVLMFFVVSGLITYRRFWRGFFRWPSRHLNIRAWWSGIHRFTGVWVFPFLIIIALTGFFYFVRSIGLVAPSPPVMAQPSERSQIIPDGFNGAALDRAIAVARDAMPDLDIELVSLPFGPSQGIAVYGQTGSLVVTKHANQLLIDPVTYKILGKFRAENISAILRLQETTDSLHAGIWGGLLIRALWFGLGLFSTFLAISGAMVYASRVLNSPGVEGETAIGRIWYGMTVLKWGLVAYVIIIVGLAIYRFGL